MNSMIKYFGGKNGISNKLIEYFPENYLEMNYIEPFCGSAAMLFRKEKSDIEIINDIDKNIYSLFKCIIDKDIFVQFKHLCDLSIYSEDLLKEYSISLKNDELSMLDRAYKFFYCNRVSYSGVGNGFSTSGVIRRKMSKSVSDYLSSIDNLFDIHNRLSSVVIHNTDAISLIKKWDKINTFMYCDSPYANETRTSGRYEHDFEDDDQDKYLETILSVKNAKLLISGYMCDRYKILEENGFKRVDLVIKTQNNNIEGKSKTESLWFNY
jgi:DNA adenine methylase